MSIPFSRFNHFFIPKEDLQRWWNRVKEVSVLWSTPKMKTAELSSSKVRTLSSKYPNWVKIPKIRNILPCFPRQQAGRRIGSGTAGIWTGTHWKWLFHKLRTSMLQQNTMLALVHGIMTQLVVKERYYTICYNPKLSLHIPSTFGLVKTYKNSALLMWGCVNV